MDAATSTPLILFTFVLFVFGGLATYTLSEGRHRHRWRRFAQRPVASEHAGPAETRAVQTQSRAPKTIRRTALWSIYMGQMAVPGGLLGLFGAIFGGLGLISIPGMILAIRIWRLGYAMLRNQPTAAQEARKLARFAVVLNIATVGIGLAVLALGGIEGVVVTAVLVVYGLVSVAHADAMERCADLLDADHQARAPSPDPDGCPAPGRPHAHG